MTEIPNSLVAAFFTRAQQEPNKLLYSQFLRLDSHDEKFSLIQRTFQQVAERVSTIATFLKKAGVKPGDSVGIISASRPEWLEADIAIMAVGAVVASLYPSLVEAEVAYILYDSGSQFVFAENTEQLDKILNIANKTHQLPATDDRPATEQLIAIKQIISFEETASNPLVVSLDSILAEGAGANLLDSSCYESLNQNSLASIVYTSGTTGPQKGVMQTHGNHLANIRQAREAALYNTDSSLFILLPLAHSFEKLMAYLGFIAGVHLQFPSISDRSASRANQRRTLLDLSQSSCSIVPLVPRILEKMKEGIEQQASKKSIKGYLLKMTLLAAARNASGQISVLNKILFLASTPLRTAIKRKLFGNLFQYVICGGAKLAPEINSFFAGLNIEVLEGYGLTETCVATNCNRPGENRIGTVGPVLANDIELKFAEDGEILFRGPNVALGYRNQPTATKKAWDTEGWFHTGDLGIMGADGCLSISGRKKEILVTSGGKKISPDRIEGLLKAHEFLSQALLVGESRSYCVALVTPNREHFQSLLGRFGSADVDELMRHAEIINQLSLHLDQINSKLASFETIKKILLLKHDFSVENGFLTPTLKMRRGPILKRFHAEIEQLYNSSDKVLVEE